MLSSPEMFNAPQAQSQSTVTASAEYIQPTLNHGLRVWWAFYWRTSVISGVLSFAAAYGVHQLYENTTTSAILIQWTQRLIPYVFSYAVAFFVMRSILHKDFRHFRVALSSQSQAPGAQSLEPTFRRTLRVWWAYSWRTAIFGIVALVIVSFPMGLMLGLFAPPPVILSLFSTILGLVVGGGVGLFVLYSNVLDEELGDFRVVLLHRARTPEPSAVGAVPGTALP
jgi:hypothetical protein